jgi:UDP:flavonoid glycosyltransferase YjiC (YdhE family)
LSSGEIVLVASAGAGGDFQPLVSAALALRERGHDIVLMGDAPACAIVSRLGISAVELPPSLDLGPRLFGEIQRAMTETGGDPTAAGPLIVEALSRWAAETSETVETILVGRKPSALVTSLFGVEVLQMLSPDRPWAVINSTFYIGPNPPRPLPEDFAPRTIPLVERFASLLGSARLVLHATDQVFDFGFDGVPPSHHYVGPLGIWEPPSEGPSYLDEPGDPWILVTLSSQLQDDVPIATACMDALRGKPLRAVMTFGPGRTSDEFPAAPENVRLVSSAPHSKVLEKARLLVSHAGHGSVMKALWWGRPMVLIPWGRDQPGVAARAQTLGVAEVLDRDAIEPESVSAAIDRILADGKAAEEAQRHGERLRETDPAATAASLIGSHLLDRPP